MSFRPVRKKQGPKPYESPFVGPIDHVINIEVDPSVLDDTVVDSAGLLKPGTPIKPNGTLVADADVDPEAFPVIESTYVAEGNTQAQLDAAQNVVVVVNQVGALNRKIVEENLERVLSAKEIVALANTKTIKVF